MISLRGNWRSAFALSLALSLFGCGDEQGSAGEPTAGLTTEAKAEPPLFDVREEPPGANCANGGIEVTRGRDKNDNGKLDRNEFKTVEYICFPGGGSTDSDFLMTSADEAAGAHCAAGGKLFSWGQDEDHNGALSPSETSGSAYICNGPAGAPGQDGQDGEDGQDGQDGVDGEDGKTSLATTAVEGPGDRCAAGGVALSTGIDENDNGTLDPDEVLSIVFICNGRDGAQGPQGEQGPGGDAGPPGATSLVALDDEPAGANCPAGGVRVRSGLDLDDDGELSLDETTSTKYVCNGTGAGTETSCTDAVDNDGDGDTDCADQDCHGIFGCEFFVELTCNDGFDNDGDGNGDCADSDCNGEGFCQFPSESSCFDGQDNDGDSRTDCADVDCNGHADFGLPCEPLGEQSCSDGFDNDADGHSDCVDSDCDGLGFCQFGTEETCNDFADNDADGQFDCQDQDCDGLEGCEFGVELSCSDGRDNDGDTRYDCFEPECSGIGACLECYPGRGAAPFDPLTGFGNFFVGQGPSASVGSCGGDANEAIVYFTAPPGLASLRLVSGGNAVYVRAGNCSDSGAEIACGINEVTFSPVAGETYFVFLDSNFPIEGIGFFANGELGPGAVCDPLNGTFPCAANSTCLGGVCVPYACSDGLDNDGDLLYDYPSEPGCTSPSDTDEADPIPAPQCADGIDNDGDGFIDYPADPTCNAASGANEDCQLFGTNSFGYRGCASTAAVPPCDDISLTGAFGCSGDDCQTTVTLPFPFEYFGIVQTSVGVISNGKLGFLGTTAYSNSCTIEPNTIAAFWDDLYPPSGGSVRYQTLGSPGQRRFVVQWNIPHISGGTLLDIRAVLYEGSNDIRVCYVDTTGGIPSIDLGASATAGISGPTDPLMYSCNTPVLTQGLVLDYTHP